MQDSLDHQRQKSLDDLVNKHDKNEINANMLDSLITLTIVTLRIKMIKLILLHTFGIKKLGSNDNPLCIWDKNGHITDVRGDLVPAHFCQKNNAMQHQFHSYLYQDTLG